jgi:5-(carboxyamino)imidazole ribonucleotide synthase
MKVGILGGGQLGRMLALAGYPLGLRFRVLDGSPEAPAGFLAEHLAEPMDDPESLAHFAEGLDLITYEWENVPVPLAESLSARVPVLPHPRALAAAQDRLTEKSFFRDLGVPTPPFAPADTRDELEKALDEIGAPAVLKTRRLGYDGKGQFVLRARDAAGEAWAALGGTPLILEGFINFEREVSLLAVRSRTGELAFYPLVENHHPHGILGLSLAPAPALPEGLQALAERYARAALEALDYAGVLAIEFFQCAGPDGPFLVVNEMAPRVHNSGHWTIEGAESSQFENHLRAILGLPLGSTALRGPSAMLNVIGEEPDAEAVLRIPGAHLHLYDKSPAPGRKLGHVTLLAPDVATLEVRLPALRAVVEPSRVYAR